MVSQRINIYKSSPGQHEVGVELRRRVAEASMQQSIAVPKRSFPLSACQASISLQDAASQKLELTFTHIDSVGTI